MIDKLTMAATIEKVKKIPGTAAQRAETAQAAAEAAAEEAATHNYGIVVTDGKITQMTSEGTTYDVQDSKAQASIATLTDGLLVAATGSIAFDSQGYINPQTGGTSSSDKYCRTSFAAMPKVGVYTATPKVGYKVYARKRLNDTAASVVDTYTEKAFTFYAAQGEEYRWCVGTTDNSDLLLENVPDDAVTWVRHDTDSTLTLENKAADAKATGSILAAEYDSTASYTAGQYAMHEGTLYRATANTAGTWTSADWTAVTVGGEMTADKAALAAETTARETEDADIYMEPWQLMLKKYFITEGSDSFVVKRNHIVYATASSATARNLRTLVGEYRFVTGTTLGNFTPLATELIPVSVFGNKIKMGFCVDVTDGVTRLPRFGYKFCTVSDDIVTPGSYSTVPENAVAGQICEATVDVPEGATHVYFGLLFSDGYNVGTYDMVYKVDKGE